MVSRPDRDRLSPGSAAASLSPAVFDCRQTGVSGEGDMAFAEGVTGISGGRIVKASEIWRRRNDAGGSEENIIISNVSVFFEYRAALMSITSCAYRGISCHLSHR